jgi:sugar lactone lactonase YvrE
MPSASSYTNKLRALTDSRNSKVQYPGSVVNTYRPALSLTCDTNMVPSVVTIAGVRDTSGYTGDGSLATQATLNNPYAVCTDSIGNVYISDTGNGCVRKIDTAGKITTLQLTNAGSPITFASGSGGPRGMTIGSDNTLYITDPYVRPVAPDGRIVCANSATGVVTRIIFPNNRDLLFEPVCVWLIGNDLYLGNIRANSNVGNIRRLTSDTFSSTVYDFRFPLTVAVGPDGSVYSIEQTGNGYEGYTPNRHCVRRYKNGVYSTFAGVPNSTGSSGDGGLATAAKLNNPSSVFADAFGNVYICDTGNGRIRMVSPDGIIQTVLGGGSTYNEGGHPLQIQASPVSMWFDAQGRMYFTDASSTVRRINSVYKPSWWDPVRYEKICKPCNAIVRPPPLPPVPTVLRLVLDDASGGDNNITVTPANGFIHLLITGTYHVDDYGAEMKYVTLLIPNLDGAAVRLRSATLNSSETELEIFRDTLGTGYTTIDTGYIDEINPGIENANTVLVLNFESQINFIDRVFYSDNR